MKKILGLGAVGLFLPAAVASAAMFSPAVAFSDPGSSNAMNVVGEPYARAVGILKTQGIRPTFGGSFGSDLPQSLCIVSQQKVNSNNKMTLMLDCTQAAADDAADSAPAPPAPVAGQPGSGQGTYGRPIGVPVPVG